MSERIAPGAQRTAILRGAPSGRDATELTLEVTAAPPSGAIYRAASGADVDEVLNGNGTSTYLVTYTAPSTAGVYLERWADTVPAPDVIVVDTVEVAWSALEPAAPAGPGYLSPDELRVELELDAAALSDAAAERAIRDAEELVDRLAVGYPVNVETGRKFTVTSLDAGRAVLLRRATLILAAAARNGELTTNAGTAISGPDFTVSGLVAGAYAPSAVAALRRARAIIVAAGFVATTARARP